MSTLLIILAIAAVGIFWFIGGFNKLVHLKALVDEAWSGIDVQLKRRYDLIPNLVAVVKQYATHEKSIFEQIAQARSAAINARGVEDKAAAESGLTQTLKTLFAVAENYPNLKANENFLSLQQDLGTIENDIQLARRYYNGAARNYNVAVATFPSRIIASMSGYEKVPYFELTIGAEREVPQVKF
ncbi:MAG: LemA family protein [Candidatus Dependentiae bacterium]